MIVLDNGDKIQGDASAATIVDYSLHGLDNNTLKQLADGQLADVTGDLFVADSVDIVKTIILVNTDTVARTINLYILPVAGTARRLLPKDILLGVGYSLHTDGESVNIINPVGGIVTSYATHAPSHTDGTDDIRDATSSQNGLATASQITALQEGGDISAYADSPGLITGGAITHGTNVGTFKAASLTAYLRSTNSPTGPLVEVSLAEQDNQAIPSADTTYYVMLDYNAGTPQIVTSATNPYSSGTDYTQISLGKVMKEADDTVHYISGGFNLQDGVQKLHRRGIKLRGFELAEGSVIAYQATDEFTMTTGLAYRGINDWELSPYNSGTTQFTAIYSDGAGGWTEVNRNTIDTDYYDDGSGLLQEIGNNKYSVHWTFRHTDDDHIFVRYGTDSYTRAEAVIAQIPAFPDQLNNFGLLIGKIIAPEGGGAFLVEMVTDKIFIGTAASDHGALGGLDNPADHPWALKEGDFTQDSGILVGTGSGTFQEETGVTARTSLGLENVPNEDATDPANTDQAGATDGQALTWNDTSGQWEPQNVTAAQTSYDNASSDLSATDVQAAITETKIAIAGTPAHYERDTTWKINDRENDRTTIVSPNYLTVNINRSGYVLPASTTLDVNLIASWDDTAVTDWSVASNRAGKDFYIYATVPGSGTVPEFILSPNSTIPDGYTVDNSRKIGGFHCLCVDVGLLGYAFDNARTDVSVLDDYFANHTITTATVEHWLHGFVAGDIIPFSIWDLNHRPKMKVESCTYDPSSGLWVHIYLPSWNGNLLESVYGGTIVDGGNGWHQYRFSQQARAQKALIPEQGEFVSLSIGSPQGVNIDGSADPGTTGGHTATDGLRIVSLIGCEDAVGVMWQWGREGGATNDVGSAWADGFDTNDLNVAGEHHEAPNRPLFGADWADGAGCGSRGSYWGNAALVLSSSGSSRLVSGSRSHR